MAEKKIRIYQGLAKPLAYTSNGKDEQIINVGGALRQIVCRFTGTLTTSANLAYAALAAGAEFGLIKSIQILSGTEVIADYTGEELRYMQGIWFGQFPRPSLASGATSTAFDTSFTIPFWGLRLRRPIDTSLNMNVGQYRIKINWGTHTDIASTGTAFSVTPQLDCHFEIATGETNSDGVTPWQYIETRVNRIVDSSITAATTNKRIPLNLGLVAVRGLLIYAKDSSGNDLPNKITNFRIRTNNTLLWESTFAALRDNALQHAGLRDLLVSSAKSSPMQDAQFDLNNYLWLDFCKDGFLSETFQTYGINDLQLVIDTNAAINSLYVIQHHVIPPVRK